LSIDVSSPSAPLWLLATTYSPKEGQHITQMQYLCIKCY
jgi:hypothetical protein